MYQSILQVERVPLGPSELGEDVKDGGDARYGVVEPCEGEEAEVVEAEV